MKIMRIRKNRKLTASMIWSTAASPSSPNPPKELMQPHICMVNRSPWDAPPSPPPLHNNPHDNFLSYLIPSSQHHRRNRTMEVEDDCNLVDKRLACKNSIPTDDSIDSMKISPNIGKNTTILPTPPSTTRKNSKISIMGPPRKQGRPRNMVESSSLPLPVRRVDSNEFVYYSGFGPRWGKRRGSNDTQKPIAIKDIIKVTNERKNNVGMPSSQIKETNDEMDYINIEDDDEEHNVRKRVRKSIKAKSLKSLISG